MQKAQSDWHHAQTILQSVGDVSVGVDARSLSEIVEDVEFNELHVLARFWARVTSVRLSGLRVQNTIQVGLTNSFPQIIADIKSTEIYNGLADTHGVKPIARGPCGETKSDSRTTC